MPRNTSVTLGEHFTTFIISKIDEGRFESASEAVRAGLRLLEAEEAKLDLLKAAIQEGVESGISDRTAEDVRSDVLERLNGSGQLPAK
jgi:antitoxin ParD1/3/4